MGLCLNQLAKSHGLTASNSSRFNCHEVLHGRDLGYRTRRNALPAIAFLGFLGWIVVEARGIAGPEGDA